MATVTRPKNPPQGNSASCSRAVRDLPLDRFLLPTDGRKWKSSARARAAMLQYIAQWANPDGTFERDVPGSQKPINYSPSEKKITQRFDRASFYRRTKDLWLLNLLNWDRADHYSRRAYTITVDAAPIGFAASLWPRHQVSDSREITSQIQNNRSQIRGEQVADSRETGRTSETYPSLPSLSCAPSAYPSTPRPPKSSIEKTDGGLGKDRLYFWHDQLIAIHMGRKSRIPNLERNAERHESAAEICDFLNMRGFHARIVTGTAIVTDHIPRLDPTTRHERNLVNCGLMTPEQARLACIPPRKSEDS
jgi:hypothetical protein